MPQTKAVDNATLGLIKSLQQKSYLNGFYLVGGTALALYYNHRISIDIDLFSNSAFDAGQMLERIQQDFSYQLFSTAEHTLKGRIGSINVDIIAHRYSYIREPESREGISLLSVPDLIAMKLNAISVSGQRTKDFVDIYYSFNRYSISEMVDFYKVKYNQESAAHVLKSLIYFEDVYWGDWPVLIQDPKPEWRDVKEKIEREVKGFVKF